MLGLGFNRMGFGSQQGGGVMVQVATPVIDYEDDPTPPYSTEQTIAFGDITCATEGATIWVKIDDGEYTEWEEV
jgi:hypothetical protein